ncbi:MAG TPA: hypothetical protein VIP77_07045 [Jiangellaceae bacterium]
MGRAKVQIGALAGREFQWSIPWASPDDVANLLALFHGVHGPGPFWWYEASAARRNMLPPETAAPYSAGETRPGWEVYSPLSAVLTRSPVQITDSTGRVISEPGVAVPAGAVAASPHMPVLPGRTYGASAWVIVGVASPATVSVEFFDAAGAIMSGLGASVASSSTTWQYVATAPVAAPAAAVSARVLIAGSPTVSGHFGLLRAAETAAALGGWLPGEGLPRVSILDVPEQLRAASPDPRSDYTVTLMEV